MPPIVAPTSDHARILVRDTLDVLDSHIQPEDVRPELTSFFTRAKRAVAAEGALKNGRARLVLLHDGLHLLVRMASHHGFASLHTQRTGGPVIVRVRPVVPLDQCPALVDLLKQAHEVQSALVGTTRLVNKHTYELPPLA